ncbi:MAG: ferrous iron transport protein A [Clostridia bacterium]|nr:ferrous iron transport protein A [Clostridia bacterium]MDY6184667.1 ferrous iron transport protein A [Eubacteriales bacterium]
MVEKATEKTKGRATSRPREKTLADLPVGESGVLATVGGDSALRQHLLDMGLIPGTRVTVFKIAPMGDPIELHLRGYSLTIRRDDAARLTLREEETK